MAAVDLGAHAAVAHRGVHGIGEVDGRGALRQRDELALGREAEHLVVEQFELGVLEEFRGALALLQHLDQVAQPAVGVGFGSGRAEAVQRLLGVGRVLVDRVGGNTALGDFMHQPGADLHFDAHVVRADDGGVDRAVVVLLRRRDVVLEAARHGAVGAVDDAERPVALVHRADDDAEAEDVGELAERQMLALHLAPDRVGPLLAAIDLGLDAVLGQLLRQFLLDRLAACRRIRHGAGPAVSRMILLASGLSTWKAMSSSSSRTACMPMRPASGA